MPKPRISLFEFARLVINALEAADVHYLIGGAVAMWAWATGRSTEDFDLVISLPGRQIIPLSKELEKREMLVPPDIMLDLLMQTEGDLPINAIHLNSGYKAELFLVREGDTFRQHAFTRRVLVDMGPPLGEVYVHAPEDLILNKIHYFGLSQQTKHLRDIASIMIISSDKIDMGYIDEWAERLGLTDTWREMQRQLSEWN